MARMICMLSQIIPLVWFNSWEDGDLVRCHWSLTHSQLCPSQLLKRRKGPLVTSGYISIIVLLLFILTVCRQSWIWELLQFRDELANHETIRMPMESSRYRACGQMVPCLPIGCHIPWGPELNCRQNWKWETLLTYASATIRRNKRITLFILVVRFVSAYFRGVTFSYWGIFSGWGARVCDLHRATGWQKIPQQI